MCGDRLLTALFNTGVLVVATVLSLRLSFAVAPEG
jgi:hypothetical protein